MRNYKLYLELVLKRVKNRSLINLMERVEIVFIFILGIILAIGTMIYFGATLKNIPITFNVLPKLYFSICIPAILPFVFCELKEQKKENVNYIIEILFGLKKYNRVIEMLKLILTFAISNVYLIYVLTRFRDINVTNAFLQWQLYILSIVALSKVISIILSEIVLKVRIKIVNIKRINIFNLQNLIYIIFLVLLITGPSKNLITYSWIKNINSIYLIVGLFLLILIYCFIIKVSVNRNFSNIEDKKSIIKQRIKFDKFSAYFDRAFIESKLYITFCILFILFIQIINFIIKNSLGLNSIAQIILLIAISTYMLDILRKEYLLIIINLRASLIKYIIYLQIMYIYVSFCTMIISILISSFAGDASFNEILYGIDMFSYLYSLTSCITITVILRLLFGKTINSIIKSTIVFISIILSYIIIPNISQQISSVMNIGLTLSKFLMCLLLIGIQLIMVKTYELHE